MNTYICKCTVSVNARDEDEAILNAQEQATDWDIQQTDSYCDDAATEVIRDRERN